MDRGLLIALMTLQSDFITRGQFIDGFQEWLVNRTQKLDDILIQQGAITKSQRERLSSKLLAIQSRYRGEWQMAVAENTAIASVYDDMLMRANGNDGILQMVKLIGEAVRNHSTNKSAHGKVAMRLDLRNSIDPDGTIDPHGTILHDSSIDPYATLNGTEFEDLK